MASIVTSTASATAPQEANDHDSDWEYEYSTTETETHYITMDLSIPDLLNRREDEVMHNTRGGFRGWIRPRVNGDTEMLAVNRALMEDDVDSAEEDQAPQSAEGQRREDSSSDDDNNENEDEDEMPHKHRWRRARSDAAKEDGEESNKIQILDLHHEKPIISYRGMVFTGAWADTIGTELHFAPHVPDGPVPAIRNLPSDVDLLSASSARITCSPAELRSLQVKRNAERIKRTRKTHPFRIHTTGADKTGERRQQATFLENLMAAKRRMGHTDVVTTKWKKPPRRRAGTNHDEAEERERAKRARYNAKRREPKRTERQEGRAARGSGARRGKGKNRDRGELDVDPSANPAMDGNS